MSERMTSENPCFTLDCVDGSDVFCYRDQSLPGEQGLMYH